MNATVRPFDGGATQPVDDILKWMDALAGRECTTDRFLEEVLEREHDDPELPWEVLALLDRYFRNRKIPHDVFVSLKARLQKESRHLGNTGEPMVLVEEPFDVPEMTPEEVAPRPVHVAPVAAAPPPPLSPPLSSSSSPHTDDLLRGRYRITEILSRDSSGVLAEALDEVRADVPGVRRRISLQLIDGKGSGNADLLQRAYRLQSLSHPCIQRVFDVDVEQGEPFLTMESLTGMSLEQLISTSGARLEPGTAMTIIRAVASALAYAHAQDVCHGDVRAANVFITETGEVRLRGFEMRGRELRANVADDRLAFAWLAYEVLAGLQVRGPGNIRRPGDERLRQPEGITRDQWRVLHAALLGKEDRLGDVLTVFAGDGLGARVMPLNAFAPAPRRTGGGRIAAGFVAALVVGAAWLYIDSDSGSEPGSAEVQPVAQQAPQPPVPAEPAARSATAAEAVAAPAPTPAAPAPPNLRARLDFPSTAVEVTDDQPFAIIPVRRRDNLNGTVTFRWWTETGSAEVNRDFLRIQPRTEMIADGDQGVELRVPLLPDPGRQQPLTFYVKIDAPGAGATLGSRTLTQVTIYPKQRLAQVSP